MGWMSDVQQKKRAIDLVHAGVPVTEVARCFGKSRQCLHKWLRRYEAEGEAGLQERSRAPHEPAHGVSEQMRRRIVQRGRRHKKDGARVVQDWLLGLELNERVPAVSTVHGASWMRRGWCSADVAHGRRCCSQGQASGPSRVRRTRCGRSISRANSPWVVSGAIR